MDKLFAPFKDRLTIVDFKPYTVEELAQITELVCGEIEFESFDAKDDEYLDKDISEGMQLLWKQ